MLALAHKEWREIVRDRFFLALAFFVPPILMIILGYGLTNDLENIPFAILDQDRTPTSREYGYKFIDSRYFRFCGYLDHERQVDPQLADNHVRFVLVIPPHFERRLRSGRDASVQTLIDGVVPRRAETIGGYVGATSEAFNVGLVEEQIIRRPADLFESAAGTVQPVSLQVRYLYNQPLDTRWGIVPGVMMLMLVFLPPMLTAVSIVREKESGAIDNVYGSTLSRVEFLIGKFIPYAVVSCVNALVLWFMTVAVFNVPFRGAPLPFFAALVLFVMCTTAMGLIVSLLVRSQITAIVVMVIVTLIPTLLYTGMFSPIASLNTAGRFMSRLLPGTYFYRIVQSSFLKGRGLAVYWTDALVLAAFVLALLTIGCLLFRKRPQQ
jgi:ABC-2 type transport system permease protein/ribosome-dependent ATPase